ncbi:uncharacterized protein LOC120256756 [Dioscorea cayenensis subsp. rotundata]|uniref:Uncharacterized protein LOC120256756 n=1 Tax=Dioscorea cayennensis subsp. rotundata TaxID=55577 RepID=A0AB40B0V3_DIOCR|nr:uncharacterized protein LOC120256756 [Dioscorea cayenensis subsp. rotundata]
MAVALPRDCNSHMHVVSMLTSVPLPRDMVASLDADPGTSSRVISTPQMHRDVEEMILEIPPLILTSSPPRDLRNKFFLASNSTLKPLHEDPLPKNQVDGDLPRVDQPLDDHQADDQHCDGICPSDPTPCDSPVTHHKARDLISVPIIPNVDLSRDKFPSSTISITQENVSPQLPIPAPEDFNTIPSDDNLLKPNISPTYSSQIIASAKYGTLPDHLKFLPPAIPIPEGYTWVVIHGGWTLIPKVNSDKFVTPDQPPITPTVSDPLDEELVDWDDDEDDQEFLADDFADVNDISEECDDFADPAIIASVVQHSEVRRSDRNKKPSTRWNEEAGFIQHPPRSSKKKIPEDPREGTIPQVHSSLNSWSDAQFQNYSIACGVKFLGSPQHKSKCFTIMKNLELERSSSSVGPEGTTTKAPNSSL